MTLRVVGDNVGIEFPGYTINRNAVLCFDNKLLLQPELLLKLLKLSKEINDFVRDTPKGFHFSQILLNTRRAVGFNIVKEQHFVLDVKIKLITQELAQIFMDEVIERIACRIFV